MARLCPTSTWHAAQAQRRMRVRLAADGFWRPSNQQMGVMNSDPAKQLGATELGARRLAAPRRADLPEDRRVPHVLRRTFCTHLADAGTDTAVIRELAGHADIRTTSSYTAVNPDRLEHAGAERAQQARGAGRAAMRR